MDGCIGVFEVVKFHTKRHRAIQKHLRDYLLRVDTLPYGAASVGKALGQMKAQNRFKRKTLVVLDADQDTAPGCILLPGDDAPGRVIFKTLSDNRWEGVATRIDRSHSDLVDLATAAMTLPDHHDWIRHVADGIVIGGNELWRAMVKAYLAREPEASFRVLLDAIQAEFGG